MALLSKVDSASINFTSILLGYCQYNNFYNNNRLLNLFSVLFVKYKYITWLDKEKEKRIMKFLNFEWVEGYLCRLDDLKNSVCGIENDGVNYGNTVN